MHIRSVYLTPEEAEAALELFEYANDDSREVGELIDALRDELARSGCGDLRVALDEAALEAALDLLEEYEDTLDLDGLEALASFESAAGRMGWII